MLDLFCFLNFSLSAQLQKWHTLPYFCPQRLLEFKFHFLLFFTNCPHKLYYLLFFPIEPAEELVQVNDLEYGSLVPTANDTFRTIVSWKKPEFTHSEVKHYKYKMSPTDASQRERRGTPMNTEITTVRMMN